MKQMMKWTLLWVLSGFFLMGCGQKKQNNLQQEKIPVQVVPVQKQEIERRLEFTGTIEPWQKTDLGAQMSGTIRKIFVDVGDVVKKGDLLVQMDDAQLTQARVQYELAKMDYERMKPLLEEGSISQNQFDKIKGAYEAAKAAYELVLENTRIRAPFSGVVTERWKEEGEVFILMPGAAGSPAILRLMQIDPVKIKVAVSESDFPRLQPGLPADVWVDVLPGEVFSGKVSRIDPAIDPLTRTFRVEIQIPNPEKKLRPGMFARVSILLGKEQVLAVPRSALIHQPGSGSYYSYVVEEGVARRREVKQGSRFDELVEITSGLREGDQIVIEGQYRLKDGSPVTLVSGEEVKTTQAQGGE